MKPTRPGHKENAAGSGDRKGLRPLNVHLLNTANMLTAAAWPYMHNPRHREAALKTVKSMLERMMFGIAHYNATEIKVHRPTRRIVWQAESSKLLQIANSPPANAKPVLIVPSLINRHDILDLDENHSFAAYLEAQGFDPYILCWGDPSDAEIGYRIDDYIAQRLNPALGYIYDRKGPVHVVGYCMGGTMAAGAAATLQNRSTIKSLTLLAAPWDFEVGDKTLAMRIRAFHMAATGVMDATGRLPVDWIQALFASIDPLFAFNKFRAFAEMPQDSPEAKRFVMVEDWLNDGVDLVAPAARQALEEWYIENQPCNGVWTIGDKLVDATKINCPTLVVAASNDRLVPQESAQAIVQQIDACKSLSPDIGHIGMMASNRAIKAVWEPVAGFMKTACP